MACIQDRLKLKRTTCDTWSTREQLCLASSVLKSGDQNWMSVSRSLRPFVEKEALRPPDWFSQKSCAIQYAHLLENADTPKRKKRETTETAGETIVRRLTQERIAELGQILAFQRDEYQQLKNEVNLLRSGSITEEKLQKMWLAIMQEEREQEQKARAHSAWLAKRQQKQELQSRQVIIVGSHRKYGGESTADGKEIMDSLNEDDEEKKNKGGRSPLLTSLLKSPSPTTQVQASASSTQVVPPTIASLLGSSPKVQTSPMTHNVSSQLHQFVTTSSNAPMERPSIGAPTLSMLLESPSNAEKISAANLQTSTNLTQQNLAVEMQVRSHAIHTPKTQNNVVQPPPVTIAPASIPISQSMVQIIDHIDDVIHKDIMADVIDKDEINEIIGDIEELIKGDISSSTSESLSTNAPSVIKNLTTSEINEVVTQERRQPRDVDESVSLSNSPQSEMAIEEIDSSTSNIAEIIGSVAIELIEPKVVKVARVDEAIENDAPKDVAEPDENDAYREITALEDAVMNETKNSENVDKVAVVEENLQISVDEEKDVKKVIDVHSVTTSNDIKESDAITSEKADGEKNDTIESQEGKDSAVSVIESDSITEEKAAMELDQLEIHLAKIIGHQEEVSKAEVENTVSAPINDIPNVEEADNKSQDISFILEDDQNSRGSVSNKKPETSSIVGVSINQAKDSEETEDNKDLNERCESECKVNESDTLKLKDDNGEVPGKNEIEDAEKEEDSKDFYDNSNSNDEKVLVADKDISETERIEETLTEICTETPEEEYLSEDLQKETFAEIMENKPIATLETSPLPKIDSLKEEIEIKEDIAQREYGTTQSMKIKIDTDENDAKEVKDGKETKEISKEFSEIDPIVKREPAESIGSTGDDIGELDEEESGLSKLTGGRAMKTYSKKQNVSIDSEPENEGSGEGADYRAWKKAVMLVYNRLATHKYASVFLRPITEDQAPGYHSVVFRPMDLLTIKKNIDNGTIRSTSHFQRDVMLMFQNAIMYNKHDTFVYKMAISMQEECLQHMQILVQVTGEGPFRRETRTAASSSSEISESSVKRKRSHITPSPHDTDSPRTKKRRKSEND
ncbi:bromodomain-containing protein 8 [Orussus abietinus]|uniref:bromodomain-containing protein 8 n=1 Tax=Orussus abietinus TaxID=222816 RepID=UPI00062582D4|nr:bromodomain-containing protein 8 [Orussus abietinus]